MASRPVAILLALFLRAVSASRLDFESEAVGLSVAPGAEAAEAAPRYAWRDLGAPIPVAVAPVVETGNANLNILRPWGAAIPTSGSTETHAGIFRPWGAAIPAVHPQANPAPSPSARSDAGFKESVAIPGFYPEVNAARAIMNSNADVNLDKAAQFWYFDGLQWQTYRPSSRVLVVGPGSGMGNNPSLAHAYNNGFSGFQSEIVYDPTYDSSNDRYPPGWDSLRAQQRNLLPDEAFQYKNLATFVRDRFCPRLVEQVQQGFGPAAVIAGSRGGQVCVGVIWQLCFRGPTVVLNGGVSTQWEIPPQVSLVVATVGQDFFGTSWEQTRGDIWRGLASSLARGLRMMQFHCETDTHGPIMSLPTVLGALVRAAISGLPSNGVPAQEVVQKAVTSGVCPSARVRYLKENWVWP